MGCRAPAPCQQVARLKHALEESAGTLREAQMALDKVGGGGGSGRRRVLMCRGRCALCSGRWLWWPYRGQPLWWGLLLWRRNRLEQCGLTEEPAVWPQERKRGEAAERAAEEARGRVEEAQRRAARLEGELAELGAALAQKGEVVAALQVRRGRDGGAGAEWGDGTWKEEGAAEDRERLYAGEKGASSLLVGATLEAGSAEQSPAWSRPAAAWPGHAGGECGVERQAHGAA